MTKEVIISISGLQFEMDEDEAIEVISRGEYYFRNGKHFLIYEEVSEIDNTISRCVMKLSEKGAELTKKGSNNVHMVFEEDETNITYYNTPFGEIILGITTHGIHLKSNQNELSLKLNYSLDMNYQHVSECELKVEVQSLQTLQA